MEVVEDELKKTIKRWLDDPLVEDKEKLRYILSKIEEIDVIQDKILEKVLFKAIKTMQMNQESNGLWKQYDMKGHYGMPLRTFYAPLFKYEVHRRWGTWKVTKNSSKQLTR
ncbi:hypothetical protein [Thermosipho sp. 1074]|uniref:hypothetical protein n=1 Tax=Thermosipho sp. 1074 TaxID=1643331 RepID=UPI0009865B05|nr:hypothetical protein [Thermosipho sp. 1074]OOC42168.1 hypothetical protein XO08_07740 [Thermosipho sp. 1074]